MPDPQQESLHSMAETLADMIGGHHPGRPAYYALMHAARAVKQAAQDVGGENPPARPKARLLPVLGSVGDDGSITYRKDQQEAS